MDKIRNLVTAQVGRLNQVCGPACTENRRQIPSNSTTSLIREAYLGTLEGYLGSYKNSNPYRPDQQEPSCLTSSDRRGIVDSCQPAIEHRGSPALSLRKAERR